MSLTVHKKLKNHLNPIQLIVFWFTLVLSFVMAFFTLHLPSYILHQIGTLIMMIVLFYLHGKLILSTSSFVWYCLFLWLHIVASCWLYSFVPYNDWAVAIFDIHLDNYFGWQRNMFDRLVHFCYGFLLYPLFFEVGQKFFKPLKPNQVHFIVLLWVMASSMVYELIEWVIALSLSPSDAENYNGQQGDMWDAHKDMLLASIGGVLAVAVGWVRKFGKLAL